MSDNKTPATGTLMKGKRGLVLGIATERSIAYGIAQVMAAQGAELAVSYQVDQLARRVTSLAEGLGAGHHPAGRRAERGAISISCSPRSSETMGWARFPHPLHRLFRSHRAGR